MCRARSARRPAAAFIPAARSASCRYARPRRRRSRRKATATGPPATCATEEARRRDGLDLTSSAGGCLTGASGKQTLAFIAGLQLGSTPLWRDAVEGSLRIAVFTQVRLLGGRAYGGRAREKSGGIARA